MPNDWPGTFREDIDLDRLHIIGFDHAGTYEHFKKQQTDIYEIILEILANALDSRDLGKPHKIIVFRGKHPTPDPNIPILEVKDGGEGIAMDYDHDVYKLIDAVKANSRKILRKYKIGSKGIGMLQFPNIAPTVVFTSMYEGLIVRFALIETRAAEGNEEDRHKKLGAFTHPKIVAANDETKRQFGIYENGTKVSFYDRNPKLNWILGKILMNKIAKEYAIRFVENPNLQIIVNGKSIEAPEEYRAHPPELLFKTSKGFEVRGAIWPNPHGHGNVIMFRGHRIVDQYIDPRQCEGYAECWELEPDTSRVSFIDNETTKEVIDGLRNIMRRFPSIKDDPEHKKQMDNLREIASLMLADEIPPAPVQSGRQSDTKKQEQSGDLGGNSDLGYKSKKEPDPNREIIKRVGGPHIKRGTVSTGEGPDRIMAASADQSKRTEESKLINKEVNAGADKPLMKLYNEPGRLPALLTINKDNAEYPVFKETFAKDPKAYNYLIGTWIGEIKQKVVDEIRFALSEQRVKLWKLIGRYPVVIPTAQSHIGKASN